MPSGSHRGDAFFWTQPALADGGAVETSRCAGRRIDELASGRLAPHPRPPRLPILLLFCPICLPLGSPIRLSIRSCGGGRRWRFPGAATGCRLRPLTAEDSAFFVTPVEVVVARRFTRSKRSAAPSRMRASSALSVFASNHPSALACAAPTREPTCSANTSSCCSTRSPVVAAARVLRVVSALPFAMLSPWSIRSSACSRTLNRLTSFEQRPCPGPSQRAPTRSSHDASGRRDYGWLLILLRAQLCESKREQHMNDPKESEAELAKCEETVEHLSKENELLRQSSKAFGDLAERLNARRRVLTGVPPKTTAPAREKGLARQAIAVIAEATGTRRRRPSGGSGCRPRSCRRRTPMPCGGPGTSRRRRSRRSRGYAPRSRL